jgi:hypothetical protein
MGFGHVGTHRKPLPRLLLGTFAGNAQIRVVALSKGMKRSEIIAWATGLFVGIGLTATGVVALLEGYPQLS